MAVRCDQSAGACLARPLCLLSGVAFIPNSVQTPKRNGILTGAFILRSDARRMELKLVGASCDVVAGDRDGCGLHSNMVTWFESFVQHASCLALGVGALSAVPHAPRDLESRSLT